MKQNNFLGPYMISKTEDNNILVIGSSPPYYVGKLWYFTNEDKFAEKIANNNFHAYQRIDGYMILISIDRTIDNVPVTESPYRLQKVLNEMIAYYLKVRIKEKKGYYRRYLINK